MKRLALLVSIPFALSVAGTPSHAHANYIGYSGAPGSSGRCASSCHGAAGGTIQATGFPTEYVPGQVYTVTISHSAGVAIRQLNGSCRIGTGSVNAGVIAAGTNTVTYNTPVETNGIHLSSIDLDTGTFDWTAPVAGTGEVRLYIAGHQGSTSGANTDLVLVATEPGAGILDGGPVSAVPLIALGNYPNPFSGETTIRYILPHAAPVRLEIFDLLGRTVESYAAEQAAGAHSLTWIADRFSPGIYFCRIEAGGFVQSRKMLLSK